MNEYYLIFLVIIAWIIFRLFFWQRKNYGYKCPHCYAEFQPTSWLVYLGPHFLFRRYLIDKATRSRTIEVWQNEPSN